MTAPQYEDTVRSALEKSRHVAEDMPVREWVPLKQWPAVPHDRQAEIDAHCRADSGYAA